jgi:salicylate hydroxylase
MRPYLAQGAAMALEDAWTIGQLLAHAPKNAGGRPQPDWSRLFQRYADIRWPRNARVQAQSVRNGRVFHAQGWVRRARNLALRLAAPRLMDQPWLYSGPPRPV